MTPSQTITLRAADISLRATEALIEAVLAGRRTTTIREVTSVTAEVIARCENAAYTSTAQQRSMVESLDYVEGLLGAS